MLETLPLIIEGKAERKEQDQNEVTYAYAIKREEEKIDFSKTSRQVFNQVRGLCRTPGAYMVLDNKIIKVYEGKIGTDTNSEKQAGEIINIYKDGIGIKTNDGEYIVTKIKPEGKKEINIKDYLNGKKKEDLLGKICM